MGLLEAIILGIIQGLSEFLPISSSGHLEIANALIGEVGDTSNLAFVVAVHGATVLSTIVVFWRDIVDIFKDLLRFEMNEGTRFAINIAVSMIPVLVVGMFFKEQVEGLFGGSVGFVGCMLVFTSVLLALSYYLPKKEGEITPLKAIIIGIMQAVAVIPGVSRSGATISTGLILGVDPKKMARFSFLMVLVPILGANFMDIVSSYTSEPDVAGTSVSAMPIIVGAIAAFITGVVACRYMVNIVRKGKLIWFAVYCFVAGVAAIIYSSLI
ncbi:MAG: undecaprenyl-diphosphate phosphatase [Rikenellaceae bacterium]